MLYYPKTDKRRESSPRRAEEEVCDCLADIRFALFVRTVDDVPDKTEGRLVYGTAPPDVEFADRIVPLLPEGAGADMGVEAATAVWAEEYAWFGAGWMLVGFCVCLNIGS